MPTIKIDIDNDSINNPIIDDRCSLLIDKINNKKKTKNSKQCRHDENKGEIIGQGQFSTVYEYIETKNAKITDSKNKYIIKDSNIYAKINKIKHKNELVEDQLQLLNQHENEISNIKTYTDLAIIHYPHNFIKYYDMENDCACDLTKSNHSISSNDSNDDDFLINQMILERACGQTLDKYDNLNDEEDMKLIFFQLIFIIMNMNMIGAFHNDIKMNNLIIEKSEMLELELKPINSISKSLQLNNLLLKTNKTYFPLVKFIDYSLSYVHDKNTVIDENSLKIYINNLYVPIEIHYILKMYSNTIYNKNDEYKKLESLRDELFNEKYLALQLPRVTKDNINNFQEIPSISVFNTNNNFNTLKITNKEIINIMDYYSTYETIVNENNLNYKKYLI
jgi:hypothetical protein